MSVTEREIEQEIKASGKTDRRLTPEYIDSRISSVDCFRHSPTSSLTICVLTTVNGFSFIGHSASVDPDNDIQRIGEKLAIEDARRQIWSHEGYVLKSLTAALAQSNVEGLVDHSTPPGTIEELVKERDGYLRDCHMLASKK